MPKAVALFACALAAALSFGCGPSAGDEEGVAAAPAPPRDVILITVDTWRGDHFDAERAGAPLTPALSAFANSGVRFTAAHSVASETSPGTSGFLTGLIPRRSGVVANVHMLPADAPSLATLLAGHGFATTAVVSNPVLRPGMGFEQGFDDYRLVRYDPASGIPKARAPDVSDAALAAFDALPEDAAGRFLWVHYLDPHGPYLPPADLLGLFPVERFEAPSDIPFLNDQSGRGGIPVYQREGVSPPTRDGRDYLARYAAEVRSMDREAGRLLDGLAARGVLDRAVVVLTSDHGEALAGDHGYYFSHNNGLTEDQVHVPMVIRCPGCPFGGTVDRPVSTVDVVPTVLARLGLPGPPGVDLDGVDLFGPQAGSRPFAVFSQRGSEVAVREGDWKLVWPRGREPRLFDLATDPWELIDLAAEHPDRLAALVARVRDLRARPAVARAERRDMGTPAEREELKALGYL